MVAVVGGGVNVVRGGVRAGAAASNPVCGAVHCW